MTAARLETHRSDAELRICRRASGSIAFHGGKTAALSLTVSTVLKNYRRQLRRSRDTQCLETAIRGDPCSRKYATSGQPAGAIASGTGGGSAATREIPCRFNSDATAGADH